MKLEQIFPKSNFFFSGYFRIPKDRTKSLFVYQNDTEGVEEIAAVIFPPEGVTKNEHKVIERKLAPSEALVLDTDEIRAQLGDLTTEGTILLCVSGEKFDKKSLTSKDLALHWTSKAGGTLFAIGPFGELNSGPDRSKKNFFMFCPIVVREGELGSFNIIINHSSDPAYRDAVELTPKLSNLSGELLIGKTFTLEPFGCATIDIKTHFGQEGLELLKKTGGEGGMTIQHSGHILASYFGQADPEGNIICGNHTQPPSGAVGVLTGKEMWKDCIKRTFPFLVTMRHMPKNI